MNTENFSEALSPDCELDPEWSGPECSRVFRMSASRFALELLFRYAWVWLLSLSCIALIGLLLGITVDIRWLVAGLMVVCILIPLAVGFLYYFYGLRRGCFVNTVPHRLLLSDNGITARLWINDSSDESEGSSQDSKIRYRDEFFPFESMTPFVIGKDSACVPLKKPSSGFLWIPADAFGSPEHLSSMLKRIDEKTASQEIIEP